MKRPGVIRVVFDGPEEPPAATRVTGKRVTATGESFPADEETDNDL